MQFQWNVKYGIHIDFYKIVHFHLSFVGCLFHFIIMDLLHENSYMPLQTVDCRISWSVWNVWKTYFSWFVTKVLMKNITIFCEGVVAMISFPWKVVEGVMFETTTPLCVDGADPCNFPTNITIQNETRTHAHMHTQYIFSICMIPRSRSQCHQQLLSPGLIS